MTDVWHVHATVTSVHDGDTFRADIDCGWQVWVHDRSVRVLGINAPELWTPEGKTAQVFAEPLLLGKRVVLESWRLDKYGRALCNVKLPSGEDFATAMILAGHAVTFMPTPTPEDS